MLVNGVLVMDNGAHTGATPGKVLRGPGGYFALTSGAPGVTVWLGGGASPRSTQRDQPIERLAHGWQVGRPLAHGVGDVRVEAHPRGDVLERRGAVVVARHVPDALRPDRGGGDRPGTTLAR